MNHFFVWSKADVGHKHESMPALNKSHKCELISQSSIRMINNHSESSGKAGQMKC
jgi:hypothetical protein